MVRTTLMMHRARRCSGMVVAATAAALILTPGAAFAAGQPAGPGQPDTGHSAGAGHAGGDGGSQGASHNGGHGGSRAGGHQGGRSGHGTTHPGHSTGHAGTGHSASHTTGHAGHGSTTGHSTRHTTGRTTGHTAGHTVGHATGHTARRTTGHPASHATGLSKADPTSGASTAASSGGGASSDTSQGAGQEGMADTVTKLSVSNAPADDGTLTLTARVSMAHRTTGASPATGTVEFTVDGASSGPIPLSGGRATVGVALSPGEHTATARYSGDAEHAPSESGPVSISAT